MDINDEALAKYSPIVKRIAKCTPAFEDCEQEIWLNLLKAKPPSNLRNEFAFVIDIAFKSRISFMRRQSRSTARLDVSDIRALLDFAAPQKQEPERVLLCREKVSCVREVVGRLSDEQREIVDLIIENASKKEYCQVHGIKTHAANKRCRKLKSQLSEPLKELSDVCH